jgi:predicted naringenin-chalcone synthase
LSKIISIGTAVPIYKHDQQRILQFMQAAYALNEVDARKLRFLYHQSSIATRYSTIADYSANKADWTFYPQTENIEPFPSLEKRMLWYKNNAAALSVDAIKNCLPENTTPQEITHLITVSCTGMSAPGLDLEVMEMLHLPKNIYRTSINFMGCYAAIHALKMADAICKTETDAKVMIVCTELCTLHFQREATRDNMASSLLFADGAAAVLVTHDSYLGEGLFLKGFYSEVITKGKNDMSWELSSSGFLMTLSGYVPDLIEADFGPLMGRALNKIGLTNTDISNWCIHPGGKRILDAIHKSLDFKNGELNESYEVLQEYGNMSSPTILFVLKKIMDCMNDSIAIEKVNKNIFGAAFGPGLTMETFVASQYA